MRCASHEQGRVRRGAGGCEDVGERSEALCEWVGRGARESAGSKGRSSSKARPPGTHILVRETEILGADEQTLRLGHVVDQTGVGEVRHGGRRVQDGRPGGGRGRVLLNTVCQVPSASNRGGGE